MVVATTLIVLAIVSDAIDGFFARKNNEVTNLGKALDPIADKICILTQNRPVFKEQYRQIRLSIGLTRTGFQRKNPCLP